MGWIALALICLVVDRPGWALLCVVLWALT